MLAYLNQRTAFNSMSKYFEANKPEEHPFAPYVRILGKGRRGSRALTFDEAYSAMGMILRKEVEDVQLGAFMMLMRVKEETNDELTGFAEAVRETLSTPSDIEADLDWSSYAGKRRHLPWYIFSICQIPGVQVVALVPVAGPVPPPSIVVTPDINASSTC